MTMTRRAPPVRIGCNTLEVIRHSPGSMDRKMVPSSVNWPQHKPDHAEKQSAVFRKNPV
jgi:hypothetical protein